MRRKKNVCSLLVEDVECSNDEKRKRANKKTRNTKPIHRYAFAHNQTYVFLPLLAKANDKKQHISVNNHPSELYWLWFLNLNEKCSQFVFCFLFRCCFWLRVCGCDACESMGRDKNAVLFCFDEIAFETNSYRR